MPDATLTPESVPDQFAALSTDIHACVLLDADGRFVAVDEAHADSGEHVAELGRELLERSGAPQIEVSTGTGVVYALRLGGWTLVAVTGRFALSSLVFFDMRRTLGELAA
jgi:hypothetical protein